jgi:hypothetical protein
MWLLHDMQEVALEQLSSFPVTTEQWITALGWSTEHHAPKIRTKAIQELDNCVRGVDRVELAKEYRVRDWLLRGYRELVERDREISAEEETRLGRSTTSKLFRVRDRYLRKNGGRTSGSNQPKGKGKGRVSFPRTTPAYDPMPDIRHDFEAELAMVALAD